MSGGDTTERASGRLSGLLGSLGRASRRPAGWPVRRRIAIVSAALTLVILVGFAAVVGRLATDRIRGDFRKDVRGAASGLAFFVQVAPRSGAGPPFAVRSPDLDQFAMTNDGAVRIVTQDGQVLEASGGAPELGAPTLEEHRVGSLQVASSEVESTVLGAPPLYVQYARDRSATEATVGRLWLFLGAGVLVGTLLAAMGGFAIASRAMRPIASLTAAAREIATTRDPSKRIPEPETEDEVAELSRTLAEMLRALDAARSETDQAMTRQRAFVADASHELRTPLTSILANLEMLQAALGTDGGQEERAATESALRSSRRMSRLVGDLLLLARADAGRAGARRRCDLATIAADAANEVAPVAGRRPIDVDAPQEVELLGDPDELHRMVLNLVENAVRHTPEATSVRVAVSSDDGTARLEVTDDGPGLPEGMSDRVFERFVRGTGPADEVGDEEGTGLGLAIVRAVARSHGGDVEAGNVNGGGARFLVRIPLPA